MIDIILGEQFMVLLHIIWAYCQVNTEMCEVALDSLVERWLI